MSLTGCCQKREKTSWTRFVVDPQLKILVDSVLTAHRHVAFMKDTSFGTEAMDTSGFVTTQFCNVDKAHLLAFICVQKSDTAPILVLIFKVLPTGWVYQIGFSNEYYGRRTYQVELRDMDFDDRKDLLIKSDVSGSRIIYVMRCYAYNPENGDIGVAKITDLYSTDKIECNERQKTVICYTDGGNFDTHQKIVYKWNHDTLQAIRRLDKYIDFTAIPQNIEEEKALGLSPDSILDIVRVDEYKLLNGNMKLSRKIKTDNPDQYFEEWH